MDPNDQFESDSDDDNEKNERVVIKDPGNLIGFLCIFMAFCVIAARGITEFLELYNRKNIFTSLPNVLSENEI